MLMRVSMGFVCLARRRFSVSIGFLFYVRIVLTGIAVAAASFHLSQIVDTAL